MEGLKCLVNKFIINLAHKNGSQKLTEHGYIIWPLLRRLILGFGGKRKEARRPVGNLIK